MITVTTQAGYRICTRCIMDSSDPDIEFDEQGVCIRCREAEARRAASVISAPDKKEQLERLVDQIKADGKKLDYDCVIGVSGGVDSTYVAYLVKNLGLRPLAVHLDNGWNSALAVTNIDNCLKTLQIDLYTHVLDWDEFRDLQLSFLKASTPDSEIPTDHAIFSLLIRKAAEFNVRYILNGVNHATESIVVPAWSRGHTDWKYIKSVHQQFGTMPLNNFPHCTLLDYAYFRDVKRQRQISILDYIDYDKNAALETIARDLKFARYAGKHHKLIYTRFFQTYILVTKFGYDKRRWHLSDLILSGQITREQALADMEQEIAPPDQLRQDKIFVAKKLGLSESEFDAIMALPPKSIDDYPSYENTGYVRAIRAVKHALVHSEA